MNEQAASLIKLLGLEPLTIEGGYYRETYRSGGWEQLLKNYPRFREMILKLA